jgi:hypothetical protein
MKKSIFILAASIFITISAIFVSCKPSTKEGEEERVAHENVQEAEENVQETQEDLAEAKKQANAEEWQSFKNDMNTIIDKNDAKIAELKKEIKNSGKAANDEREKKVDALKEKNEELKIKMKAYKNDANSDWQSFKREFNHDMNELGNSLKDLTVNNKK